jgi:hypothetical protein
MHPRFCSGKSGTSIGIFFEALSERMHTAERLAMADLALLAFIFNELKNTNKKKTLHSPPLGGNEKNTESGGNKRQKRQKRHF